MMLISLCLFFVTSLYAENSVVDSLLKMTKDHVALAFATKIKTNAPKLFSETFGTLEQNEKDLYLAELNKFVLSNQDQFRYVRPFIAAAVKNGAFMETRIQQPTEEQRGNFRVDERRLVELIKKRNANKLFALISEKWNLDLNSFKFE